MEMKLNFVASIRHLKANRTNSFINVTGLALGIGVVAIVLVFVLNELGYNSSFTDNNRIYRVLNCDNSQKIIWANTPFVMGQLLTENFSEVESYTHQFQINNLSVQKGQEWLDEKDVICTESSFFQVFGIKVLQGKIDAFDHSANQILLSQQMANKYFGDENPVGKTFTIKFRGNELTMQVAAVYADIPNNSTIKASMIANNDVAIQYLLQSMVSTGAKPTAEALKTSWENGIFFTTYILLQKDVNIKVFEEKLQEFGKQFSNRIEPFALSVQTMNQIYFDKRTITDNNGTEKGNLTMLYIFCSIGLLILLIACINYLNLASAQSLKNIKTMAVYKVCGARRSNLIRQMVTDSLLVALIALPLGLLFAYLVLPFVSQLLGKGYMLSIFTNQMGIFILLLGIITFLVGIISGWLISLQAGRFNLVETLKGKIQQTGSQFPLRKVMVAFQVAVFIGLIAVVFIVKKQVNYAFSKDLGFTKEGLIRVTLGDHNYQLYKQEILKNPNIIDVSGSMWIPPHKGRMLLTIPKVSEPDQMVDVIGLFVDYHFAQTMGMKVIQGQDFDETKASSGVLVNEQAVKALGLKEVIGEQTAFGQVVGVVNDFNMYSLHEAIQPMLIGINPNMVGEVAIRVNTQNIHQTIGFLKETWQKTGGTTAFDFDFTDDILNQLYDSDIRFSKIIGFLAIIAILIASMGLVGLSILLARQKTKEIGIRKVNGAKVSEILMLLNSDYIKWVIIAFLVASPITYYFMHQWLQSFAYQTPLSWWIFALSGILALTIALIAVSFQSWKAATRNPVEALRYE